MDTARRYGITADETGHFPSRVELSPDEAKRLGLPDGAGIILKGKKHPTFHKTVKGEEQAGYAIITGPDGRLYSIPKNSRVR